MKIYYVYILSSKKDGVLYVGITNNIARRIYEHQQNLISGFTQKYNIKNLVYVEQYTDISYALAREKKLKGWKRLWKIDLIQSTNPDWLDLSKNIL